MACGILLALALLAQPLGSELVQNGSFEQPDASGKRPAGWVLSGNAQWLQENGNHFVRIIDNGAATQTIALQPEWWKIRVSVRVRCRNVKRGKQSWHDARVAMSFVDESGKRVGPWPPVLCWTGTFDWQQRSRDFIIPRGAAKLVLSCAMYSSSGVTDFDDVSVKPVALVPRKEPAPAPAPLERLWSTADAWRQRTATREEICLNGWWQFLPVEKRSQQPPGDGEAWGWIAVPGSWRPGEAPLIRAPDWWEFVGAIAPDNAAYAWYRRRVKIPADWAGRQITLYIDTPGRAAYAYVNGRSAGMVDWPGGELDITELIQPGREAEIAIFCNATSMAPGEFEKLSPQEQAKHLRSIRMRGLCGDVMLRSQPRGPRIARVLAMPSVRRKQLVLRVLFENLDARQRYFLRASASFRGRVEKAWRTREFTARELTPDGFMDFALPWADPKLWDIDQPNLYELRVNLHSSGGRLVDAFTPVTFGFREFWADGRVLYLNGRPFHIRAVNHHGAIYGGGRACRRATEWTLRRYREMGFNFSYVGDYQMEFNRVRNWEEIFRAADAVGYLIAPTMPHMRDIAGKDYTDPEVNRWWRRRADYIFRKAANHPSVVCYSLDHNWLGYAGDQNPRYLNGTMPDFAEALGSWRLRARRAAKWAEEYIRRLDPSREVYHHQCGAFSRWITLNCYLNWVPIADRMDWLSEFYRGGRRALFLVEFGLPHQASFQRHRGAPFIWRNQVDAEPLPVEYAAIFLGDDAYRLTDDFRRLYENLADLYSRFDSKLYFWQTFGFFWGERIDRDFLEIKALYTRYTWPAFRTWQISAIAPWDWNDLARPPSGQRGFDWSLTDLKQPGLHPAFLQYSEWYTAPPGERIELTSLGRELSQLNQEVLAYIAGKPEKFTSLDHIFQPGEAVRKQIVFINDCPRPVTFAYTWQAELAGRRIGGGSGQVRVGPGAVRKVAISVRLPASARGKGRIRMTSRAVGAPASAAARAKLSDEFEFSVAPTLQPRPRRIRVALLDPAGRYEEALRRMGFEVRRIDTRRPNLQPSEVLIVAPLALRVDEAKLWRSVGSFQAEQALPPLDRLKEPALQALPAAVAGLVARGGRVLILEQSERVMSRYFGFRTAFPGTRRAFVRCPSHPAVRGLSNDLFRYWRGQATTTVTHTLAGPLDQPRVDWLGFENTRVWRWGQWGTIAPVVVEKPHRGNFTPLLACEFDCAYTPLLEWWHPSGGRIMFCQLSLLDRSEDEPMAGVVLRRLVDYLAAGPRSPEACSPIRRERIWAGGSERLFKLLDAAAVDYQLLSRAEPDAADVIIADGALSDALADARQQIADMVRAGGVVIALGMNAKQAASWVPVQVQLERHRFMFASAPSSLPWPFCGLGPEDFHFRGWLDIWQVASAPDGSIVLPGGLGAAIPYGRGWIVLLQITPDMIDPAKHPYLRTSLPHAWRIFSQTLHNLGVRFKAPADPLAFIRAGAPFTVDLSGTWRIKPVSEGEDESRFSRPDFDDSSWREISMPAFWEDQILELRDYNGVCWLRRDFEITGRIPEGGITLRLPGIDDEDWTYINGHFIGHIGTDTHPDNYWEQPRVYKVPASVLRPGRNVIAIKIRDLRGAGGIRKGPMTLGLPPRFARSYYATGLAATDDPYRYCRW